jgi:hypothetical protein
MEQVFGYIVSSVYGTGLLRHFRKQIIKPVNFSELIFILKFIIQNYNFNDICNVFLC